MANFGATYTPLSVLMVVELLSHRFRTAVDNFTYLKETNYARAR